MSNEDRLAILEFAIRVWEEIDNPDMEKAALRVMDIAERDGQLVAYDARPHS